MTHHYFPPAYEVEFVNENLETIDVLTVKDEDIILITGVV
jgi:hypothetical protein